MHLEPPTTTSPIKPGLPQFVSLCASPIVRLAFSKEKGVIVLASHNGISDLALRLSNPHLQAPYHQASLDLAEAISESGLTKQDFIELRDKFRQLRVVDQPDKGRKFNLLYIEAIGHLVSVLTQLEKRGYKLLDEGQQKDRKDLRP